MKLAIVGASDVKKHLVIKMRDKIESEIQKRWNGRLVIISGGAKGVDTIATDVARHLGIQTIQYNPKFNSWEWYKERNQKIALECDELICFAIEYKTPVKKCYHHKEPQNHEKTAGCWTMNKARQLNKQTKLIIVRSY